MNTLYASAYFQRVAIPGTIYNELQSDLSVSATVVTMFGSIYLYIYGGMQIFSGMLIDRFGSKRIILVGGILLSMGSILFPLSKCLGMLCVARVLTGFGASLMFLCVLKELDISFNEKYFSMLLGTSLFAGYSGGLIGTLPFERAVRVFGWRPSVFAAGVVCAVITMITAALVKNNLRKMHPKPASDAFPALKIALSNRSGYPVILSAMLVSANFFLMQAIIGKKLLEDCCKLSTGTAASYTFVMTLVSMGAVISSGFLSKMIGDRRKPIIVISSLLTLIAPCMGLLMLHREQEWILPCYLIFGVSYGSLPIFSSVIKELNDPGYAASAVGILNGAIFLLVATYAAISGWMLDLFSSGSIHTATAIQYPPAAYRLILIGMVASGLLALFCSMLMNETLGRNIWAGERALRSKAHCKL